MRESVSNTHPARVLALLTAAAILALTVAAAGCGTEANVHVVEMQNLSFNPAAITIKKGDTVRWVNADQTAHNPTSDDFDTENPEQSPPGAWSADPVDPGDSFDHTFDSTGTVTYNCDIHQYMKGTVTVED